MTDPGLQNDLPHQPPEFIMPWWRWGLVCLGLQAALLGLIFTRIFPERREFVVYVLGVVAAQITCLAAWAVCGPGGIFTRVPGAIFATIGVWFVFVLGMDFERRDYQTPILTAILALGHLILVSGGLFLWRQIAPGGFEFAVSPKSGEEIATPAPVAAAESKFSLLHIMGWTTAVAILCAIGGRVFQDRMEDFFRGAREIVSIVTVTGASAAVGLIQVIALSREENRLTNLSIGYLSIPLISLLELAILAAMEQANRRALDDLIEMGIVLGSKNAIHALVVSLTYGLLYFGGLRWTDSGPANLNPDRVAK